MWPFLPHLSHTQDDERRQSRTWCPLFPQRKQPPPLTGAPTFLRAPVSLFLSLSLFSSLLSSIFPPGKKKLPKSATRSILPGSAKETTPPLAKVARTYRTSREGKLAPSPQRYRKRLDASLPQWRLTAWSPRCKGGGLADAPRACRRLAVVPQPLPQEKGHLRGQAWRLRGSVGSLTLLATFAETRRAPSAARRSSDVGRGAAESQLHRGRLRRFHIGGFRLLA